MPLPVTFRDDVVEDVRISAEEIHAGRDVDHTELGHTPREYQELVVILLSTHAAGEAFVLNDDVYAHWVADAPTTEDRFMVLHTLEEELMHAREGWRLLRQLGDLIDWTDLVPYGPSMFEGHNHASEDWAEYAALMALTDRVGCFQQEEQLEVSYSPYAEAIRTSFYPIERGHAARGRYWLRQLAETDDGRDALQAAVNLFWPRALDMFGYSHTERQHRYVYYRLKKRTNEERRQSYIAVVGAELEELGLVVPDPETDRKVA